MQADTSAAAAHVQNAATNKPHRATLVRVVPIPEGRQQIARIERHHEAIVALDDLPYRLPRQRIAENKAVHILHCQATHGAIITARGPTMLGLPCLPCTR